MRSYLTPLLCAAAVVAACSKETTGEPGLELKPSPAAAAEAPAPPKPEEEVPQEVRDLQWNAVSEDTKAVVQQSADRSFRCTATCLVGEEERWNSSSCLGKRIDLRFVSNDCEKLVVLHQLPKVTGDRRAAEVAHIYKRGVLEYAVNAGGVVPDEKKLRSAGTTFYWLAGALGIPGGAPHYAADGSGVEFDTVDGRHQTIPFVTPPRPAPTQATAPAKATTSKTTKKKAPAKKRRR